MTGWSPSDNRADLKLAAARLPTATELGGKIYIKCVGKRIKRVFKRRK